jgi:serine/threonine protein kinase
MNKYHVKDLLYVSRLSRVYRSGNQVIKRIPKMCYETNKKFDYSFEYNILQKIDSDYIIRGKDFFEDTDYFYWISDYYQNGDLYDYVQKNKNLVNDPKQLLIKLIRPLLEIHNKNICHLDLKLENFLVKDNLDYLLIDFNSSRTHNHSYYNLKPTDLRGTKPYIAPEIYEGYYCKSTDMYGLGCILYIIFTRKNIKNYNGKLLDKYPIQYSNLIKDLLSENYRHRPSVHDVIHNYSLQLN